MSPRYGGLSRDASRIRANLFSCYPAFPRSHLGVAVMRQFCLATMSCSCEVAVAFARKLLVTASSNSRGLPSACLMAIAKYRRLTHEEPGSKYMNAAEVHPW